MVSIIFLFIKVVMALQQERKGVFVGIVQGSLKVMHELNRENINMEEDLGEEKERRRRLRINI